MTKYNNGIVTIGSNTHIVLSQVATVDIGYEPSMFSEGDWQLKINGVVVYSRSNRERVEEISSFVLEKLRQFNLTGA